MNRRGFIGTMIAGLFARRLPIAEKPLGLPVPGLAFHREAFAMAPLELPRPVISRMYLPFGRIDDFNEGDRFAVGNGLETWTVRDIFRSGRVIYVSGRDLGDFTNAVMFRPCECQSIRIHAANCPEIPPSTLRVDSPDCAEHGLRDLTFMTQIRKCTCTVTGKPEGIEDWRDTFAFANCDVHGFLAASRRMPMSSLAPFAS